MTTLVTIRQDNCEKENKNHHDQRDVYVDSKYTLFAALAFSIDPKGQLSAPPNAD